MRYPASETAARHRKILDAALRLFQERGFGEVTVDAVMQVAGLTRGGFYSHFESKVELFQHVLAHGSAQSLSQARAFPTGPVGREAFVAEYLSLPRLNNPSAGSIEATLVSDVIRLPESRDQFTRHLEALIEELRRRFVRGGSANPTAEAIALLSSLVGAAQLARATDDEFLRLKIIQALQRSAI